MSEDVQALLRNWRRSIAELISNAHRNLNAAEERYALADYNEAVEKAATCVENITRALIHCYGGLPNPMAGQEEALRMLSNRLEGEEKEEFERAVDSVALMTSRRARFQDSAGAQPLGRSTETEAGVLLTLTSRVLQLFSEIIVENFSDEIPELPAVMPEGSGVVDKTWSSP